jgi:hypothetical protein
LEYDPFSLSLRGTGRGGVVLVPEHSITREGKPKGLLEEIEERMLF